ncbi:MAG TPA: molybdopterin-dependent oxidoreductase [Methanocorpusculum sp.]|nr:molybdopterin-dependent oxidoreductase [Methanocorpusculum sp.]
MIKDKATGKFKSASWDEALTIIVENFNKYNPNEIAVISSDRCCNEDNYTLQKFARTVLKTPNIDHCARFEYICVNIHIYTKNLFSSFS